MEYSTRDSARGRFRNSVRHPRGRNKAGALSGLAVSRPGRRSCRIRRRNIAHSPMASLNKSLFAADDYPKPPMGELSRGRFRNTVGHRRGRNKAGAPPGLVVAELLNKAQEPSAERAAVWNIDCQSRGRNKAGAVPWRAGPPGPGGPAGGPGPSAPPFIASPPAPKPVRWWGGVVGWSNNLIRTRG